jgi:hypothetical protein
MNTAVVRIVTGSLNLNESAALLANELLVNNDPCATGPLASPTMVWLAESWFTHVMVVPRGAVIVPGLKAKFWMVTVGAPGAGVVSLRVALTADCN